MVKVREFIDIEGRAHAIVSSDDFVVVHNNVLAGDVITVRPKSEKNGYFSQLADVNANSVQGPLSWLKSDVKKMKIEVTGVPTRAEADTDINEQLIVEYYSR
jgi:small subunit ribosomal protein S4